MERKTGKWFVASLLILAVAGLYGTAQAGNGLMDGFGGWAEIGRPGNDAQGPANRNHTTTTSDGLGSVDYAFWIGKHQVTIDDWSSFYNDAGSGRLGTFNTAYNYWNDGTRTVGGGAPAVNISFHQAAQYANWLSTGNALSGAYQIDGSGLVTGVMSRTDIVESGQVYYVLPTLDEWFKTAYFHQDTQTYSRYAHGLQTPPPHPSETTDPAWSYRRTDLDPQYAGLWPNYLWAAGSGGEEINGTFDMMGNTHDWIEDLDGRQIGGGWSKTAGHLDSARGGDPYATHNLKDPDWEDAEYGLRIVAIPEPVSVGLLGLASVILFAVRRIHQMR